MGQHRHFHWHGWFAWRPIRTVDERWTWLACVRRRAVHYEADHGDGFFWEYVRLDGYGFETDAPAAIWRAKP